MVGISNEFSEVVSFLRTATDKSVIVLHDQPNRGRTIIEKFENYARSTAFAVVIYTGDDEGKAKGDLTLKPRARQNVLFELGFFVGALTRARVAVLFEEGVDVPTDLSGVA